MQTRMHIALAVDDYASSIAEYSERLGTPPCCTVEGSYALLRTGSINLSISVRAGDGGVLRHLGFEDPQAVAPTEERDVNGITWERFSFEQQRAEIVARWPHAIFHG